LDTDVPHLVRLLQEAEAVDRSGGLISEEVVRLYLGALHHNPYTDRWVIEDPLEPGALVAHAALYLPTTADDRRVADGMLVVHPAWRLKNPGTALFAHLEVRLRGSGADTHLLRFYLDPALEAAVMFARSTGFEPDPADTYTEMRASLADLTAQPVLPEGFTLRSYREVNHLLTLVEALNRSYGDLAGHHLTTEAELAPHLAGLDLRGLHLLFAPDGRVAGTVGAALEPSRSERSGVPIGRVDSPGVVPDYRSAALYEALLLAGTAYLRRLGAVWAELESWGDEPAVLAHYQAQGFRVLRREVAYRRPAGCSA
jgi:mycothiol synthase